LPGAAHSINAPRLKRSSSKNPHPLKEIDIQVICDRRSAKVEPGDTVATVRNSDAS
jgi:hypothetical protein